MFKKVKISFFTTFMALILVLSTVVPSTLAQTSNNNESKITTSSNILELEVIELTTNEKYSTSILFLPETDWDKSLLKQLKDKYTITKYDYREFSNKDKVPSLIVSKNNYKLMFVETIFDIGNFTISLTQFIANPSLWTGFKVVMDGAAVVLPGVPSVVGVKRMMDASSTLKTSLKHSINKYGKLQKVSIPRGWERHHIFEKRFAKVFGTSTYSMLAIALPKSYHYTITKKMSQKIPTGQNYGNLSKTFIINKHIEAYKELYYQTKDPVWEFLWKFSKSRQHTARQ